MRRAAAAFVIATFLLAPLAASASSIDPTICTYMSGSLVVTADGVFLVPTNGAAPLKIVNINWRAVRQFKDRAVRAEVGPDKDGIHVHWQSVGVIGKKK